MPTIVVLTLQTKTYMYYMGMVEVCALMSALILVIIEVVVPKQNTDSLFRTPNGR